MRAARSSFVVLLAVLAAVLVGITQTLTTAFTLTATLLIVPGTGTKDPSVVSNYEENAQARYAAPFNPSVDPSVCARDTCLKPVPYIAEFWPFPFKGWGGLEGAKWNVSVASGVASLQQKLAAVPAGGQVVIFGYSQGATVTGIEKRNLAAANGGLVPANINFVMIGNPQRPNGGIFERLGFLGTVPILDATFGNPTPTNTAPKGTINTTDIAFQYDGVADSPEYVLDLPAVLNALAGFEYVHGYYLVPNGNGPTDQPPYGYTNADIQAAMAAANANCDASTYCQVHGDTRYVTLPATMLPIMQPLLDLGSSTGTSLLIVPIVDLLQPFLQTVIELGYDRTDYSAPSTFQVLPPVNLAKLFSLPFDLIADAQEGVTHAVSNLGHTTPVPLVTLPSTPSTPSTQSVATTNSTPVTQTALTSPLPASKAPTRVVTPQTSLVPANDNGASGSSSTPASAPAKPSTPTNPSTAKKPNKIAKPIGDEPSHITTSITKSVSDLGTNAKGTTTTDSTKASITSPRSNPGTKATESKSNDSTKKTLTHSGH